MKPTVRKYRHVIIITLSLFAAATTTTLFITEHSVNKSLQTNYKQLTNTLYNNSSADESKRKDSVINFFPKPLADSVKKSEKNKPEKKLIISDPYKDSTLHALNFYMQKAIALENENTQLKQANANLTAQLLNTKDTVFNQRKIIVSDGSYKDAKLEAHLKQSNKFDKDGHLIYDSSNFNYSYKHDTIQQQTDVVKRKVLGLPFKQEQTTISNGNISYSLKQPIAVLQWQLLFNSSYRIASYANAKRIGINIGTGLQANTLGLNSRFAVFYNTTQISGNIFQRMNIAVQLQKPLRTFKIK